MNKATEAQLTSTVLLYCGKIMAEYRKGNSKGMEQEAVKLLKIVEKELDEEGVLHAA